jgi:aspartyl-tRNA(Asn)/glutamyl-tRNA(Gln) amidotransferase subunit B
MRDAGELERIVAAVIAASPRSVEEFRAGKEQRHALVGQAMKPAAQGRSETQVSRAACARTG